MLHVRFRVLLLAACLPTAALAQEKPPRSLDPRLKIELFAEQPQIVTPTGIDVDAQGRVWAIESNTHFPPPGYAGHNTDRLLVMQDLDGDGRADRIDAFATGFTHAMSVAVRPALEPGQPPQVYVATRREIVILTDTNGDLHADDRQRIVQLDTPGNYPHNGLAGFAWDVHGWMYFGFGENLGAPYKIIGSDGRTLSGGAEGGNLYRCRPDGSEISQWATGFWNPHSSCIDAHGRMFTVDNDPDSRPPCRLLHIVRDGDYGYRFRNGRKGLHPFTAWNGEIPGTLPMVAGTGEAPSGIVSYAASGLPGEYRGNLLVTSWGDHRIDRFRLKPKGASFESLAEPLIVGGENFRPVGLAVAPDGSLFCTDWVLKDYKLHGKGRVWKITNTRQEKPDGDQPASSDPTPEAQSLAAILGDPQKPIVADSLASEDPFVFAAAIRAFSKAGDSGPRSQRSMIENLIKSDQPLSQASLRRALAWALASRRHDPSRTDDAELALSFPDPLVRRAAVQWIAEEHMTELRPRVAALLQSDAITADLFLATLAALEILDGKAPVDFDKTPAGKYVLPILLDEGRPAAVRRQALRLVPPNDPALKPPLFAKLLKHKDRSLKLEAVRTLQASSIAENVALLSAIAADDSADGQLRCEALVGLSRLIAQPAPERDLLRRLPPMLASNELSIETLRAVRGYDRPDPELQSLLKTQASQLPDESPTALQREAAEELVRLLPEDQWTPALHVARKSRPGDIGSWYTAAAQGGDASAGRRVFFHPLGVGCWKCHTIDGRGGAIGPDLSLISRTMSRGKLAQSILEPSKEISPQFTSWTFVMESGQVHQGVILGDTRDNKQRIGLADGREIELSVAEIDEREPGTQSIMPANLIEQLTLSEFRHLLAFLETLK